MIDTNPDTAKSSRVGFTLIEVMAAVVLSAIVMSIAVSFQINLGSAMDAARERLRTQRQAVALLDRLARDLASTYFIAPSERVKAGVNPWVFVTGRDFAADDKSDKIKFITRNYQPQNLDRHASDLAVVAYYLTEELDRPGYRLMRWRDTHMPEAYDPSFPAEDSPQSDIIGENLASFTLSLIDSGGAEVPDWNAMRKRGAKSLPVAVKIEISMLNQNEIDPNYDPDAFEDEVDDFEDLEIDDERDSDRKIYSKLVILPLRPLDWSFLESQTRTALTRNAALDASDEDDEDSDDEDDEDSDDSDDEDDEGLDFNEVFDSSISNFDAAPKLASGGARALADGHDRPAAS